MPEVFRDRFLTDGVRFEALQSNKPTRFRRIEGIQVERGHLMTLRAFEIMEQGAEEVELALPVYEVETLRF